MALLDTRIIELRRKIVSDSLRFAVVREEWTPGTRRFAT